PRRAPSRRAGPPRPRPFPSTTLFRAPTPASTATRAPAPATTPAPSPTPPIARVLLVGAGTVGSSWAAFFVSRGLATVLYDVDGTDRKSTRLNSSHVKISYAVFCLTKH